MAEKNSAAHVFTDFTNSSDWDNGISRLIGLQARYISCYMLIM